LTGALERTRKDFYITSRGGYYIEIIEKREHFSGTRGGRESTGTPSKKVHSKKSGRSD